MTPSLLRRLAYPIAGVVGAALLAGPAAVSTSDAVTADAPAAAPAAQDRVVSSPEPVRVRKSYEVVAGARIGKVQAGKKIRIVGSVTTRHRKRPVVLTERKHRKWKVIARTKSNRVGAYTFKVRAGGKAKVRVFRVVTKRFHGLRGGTTRAIKVRVVRYPTKPQKFDAPEYLPAGYVGAGSTAYGAGWSLFAGGSRWNPCRTIRWAYNPGGEKYAALPDMQRAFARLAGISGLRFRYVGGTGWRFLGNIQDKAFPTSADIVVGWASEAELPTLAGNVVGYGGWTGRQVQGADVQFKIDRGYLILDNGATLQTGFDQVGWGTVSMHEIMHSLGLDHAGEAVQMMYPTLSEQNVNPGAGDITGLQTVGSGAGCLN